MCNARYLHAYCPNELCWIRRRAPFARVALVDADLEVDFSRHTTPRDKVAVVATRPLTRNDAWIRCRPAELCVFGNGEPIQLGGAYA
jgi:predicted glutamine amidotransferase